MLRPIRLYISHVISDEDDVIRAVESRPRDGVGNLVFHFEPVIIAIECRTVDDGLRIVNLARSCGLRESGVTSSGPGDETSSS